MLRVPYQNATWSHVSLLSLFLCRQYCSPDFLGKNQVYDLTQLHVFCAEKLIPLQAVEVIQLPVIYHPLQKFKETFDLGTLDAQNKPVSVEEMALFPSIWSVIFEYQDTLAWIITYLT